jgi:hypothetical protein
MKNPLLINTDNVKEFGFKTTFNLEEKKISFDISNYTIFNIGGQNNIQGIDFEVTDPSGIKLSTINFEEDIDIIPANGNTFYIDLPNGFAQFGWYVIKGVLKEANGSEYSIEIKKNICEPKGFSNGVVSGLYDVKVNCEVPKIDVVENTNMSYSGKEPISIIRDGKLYYPSGTLDEVPFTFTPFQIINSVYTGTYTIRNKTKATYDFGDLVFVEISYTTSKEFIVDCNSNLCKILCCIQEVYEIYSNDCKSQVGKNAKDKLDRIALPLSVAAFKEKCGQNASKEITEIEKILGCDCRCGGDIKKPTLVIGGSGNSVSVVGACATTVTPQTSGNTVHYEIKTKNVSIDKLIEDDLSFSIQRVDSACNVIYKIKFNYEELANTILNTISNNQELIDLFNSIVILTTGNEINSIDGKCIMELGKYNYTARISTYRVTAQVIGVLINGDGYTRSPLNVKSTDIFEGWLNSLGLGIFTVTETLSKGGAVIIQSENNPHNVELLNIRIIQGLDTVDSEIHFDKQSKSLKQLLQAMIDFLCELSTDKIKLGDNISLCKLNDDGTIANVPFDSTDNLLNYLKAQSQAFCKLVSYVANAVGSCAGMKSLFPLSTKQITNDDYVLGTKESSCARISMLELANVIIHKSFEDTTLRDYICQQIQNCVQPVCSPVNNISVIVDSSNLCAMLNFSSLELLASGVNKTLTGSFVPDTNYTGDYRIEVYCDNASSPINNILKQNPFANPVIFAFNVANQNCTNFIVKVVALLCNKVVAQATLANQNTGGIILRNSIPSLGSQVTQVTFVDNPALVTPLSGSGGSYTINASATVADNPNSIQATFNGMAANTMVQMRIIRAGVTAYIYTRLYKNPSTPVIFTAGVNLQSGDIIDFALSVEPPSTNFNVIVTSSYIDARITNITSNGVQPYLIDINSSYPVLKDDIFEGSIDTPNDSIWVIKSVGVGIVNVIVNDVIVASQNYNTGGIHTFTTPSINIPAGGDIQFTFEDN